MSRVDYDLLRKLCLLKAPSGKEQAVSCFLEHYFSQRCLISTKDNIGNLFVYSDQKAFPQSPTIISAHMDEIGFVAYKITDKKVFLFPMTRMDREQIEGKEIEFLNGKTGTVCCDESKHDANPKYYIQVEDLNNFSIPMYATFSPHFEKQNDFITAKSLDNRIGCFIILEALKRAIRIAPNIVFVFSVQEELGNRGAKVVLNTICPQKVVVIDTTPSSTFYPITSVTIGDGVAIKAYDAGTIVPEKDVEKLQYLARENSIRSQIEVLNRGNTDVQPFLLAGVPMYCVLSIPCENGHTNKEKICINDVTDAIALVKMIIEGQLNI